MRKGVSEAILSLLHTIGRYAISNWLLVVMFSCLGTYLVFPRPLDGLSDVLWPQAEKGPLYSIVQLSYSVSGTTKHPGIVDLNINVTNEDIVAHEFLVLAMIGSQVGRVWWGPGFYRDYLSPATNVQISDPWYAQAFISTGPLKPGQTFHVTRKIEIVNDSHVRDAYVDVRDIQDAPQTLAYETKRNVIQP